MAREKGAGGEEGGADERIGDQDALEAEAAQDRARGQLHEAARRRRAAKVRTPNGRRQAEADLQHQRQQEGQGADAAIRNKEPPTDGGAEGRDAGAGRQIETGWAAARWTRRAETRPPAPTISRPHHAPRSGHQAAAGEVSKPKTMAREPAA